MQKQPNVVLSAHLTFFYQKKLFAWSHAWDLQHLQFSFHLLQPPSHINGSRDLPFFTLS